MSLPPNGSIVAGRSTTSFSGAPARPQGRLWERRSSLSGRRRRSISKLTHMMTTVQEALIDSPTIPGLFPQQRQSSSVVQCYQGSSAVLGTSWRYCPYSDNLLTGVTGPVTLEEPKGVHGSRIVSEASTSSRTTSHDQRRKEPLILSPCQGPELTRKVDTNPSLDDDVAPQVPPKALSRENKPLILAKTGVLHQAAFASSSNDVPNAVPKSVLPYSKAVAQRSEIPKLAEALSSTKPASGASESTEAPIWTFRDRSFLDGACLNLGRPMIRSNSPVSRSRSTTKSSYVEVCNSRQLPKGLSIAEAKRQLSPFDIVNLRQQAHRHARNFEVLAGTDVNQLSRALHVFDKRCEYLRKIYESLRANRQKLYSSMISGLERTKSVIFSRESLLVQKEALAELDNSIDEWILKLEQAEDRSLKVRQKLLEHIAAASILHPVVPNET